MELMVWTFTQLLIWTQRIVRIYKLYSKPVQCRKKYIVYASNKPSIQQQASMSSCEASSSSAGFLFVNNKKNNNNNILRALTRLSAASDTPYPPTLPPCLQITRRPTGFTRSPPEKSVAPIQSTKSSNWKRSFCLTCTSHGIVGTR